MTRLTWPLLALIAAPILDCNSIEGGLESVGASGGAQSGGGVGGSRVGDQTGTKGGGVGTPGATASMAGGGSGTDGTRPSGAGGSVGQPGASQVGGAPGGNGISATAGSSNPPTRSGGGGSGAAVAGRGGGAGRSAAGASAGASGAARSGAGASGSGGATGAATSGGGAAKGGATGKGGAANPGGTSPGATPSGHYQMEDLDRGVVAIKVSGGVYVGWRMFGYEYDAANPSNVSYNVYRDGTKVANVTDSTNLLDASGTASSKYSVAAVLGGAEGTPSADADVWSQAYDRIPLTPPATGPNGGTYSANDGSTGDLDGDGKYDIVLKWDPSNAKDNSQSGVTDDVFLDGYTLAGARLWRIDLGPNIRAGAHYTQISVYDFDGDGKAEVACKTAPGTKDASGAYLKSGPAASADHATKYRNSDGYVLSGPEWFTVFDGATGKELATIEYPTPRGTVSSWGDDYGNRLDRFNGGAAFVSDSGKTASGRPAIITQRGYYTRLTMSALAWRDGKLSKLWTFDSNGSGNSAAVGQGDHAAMPGDTDDDGAQEIITGPTTIGSDGTLKCTTGLGHGDAMHVGELIVGKPLSVFTVHEDGGGYDVHDGATCKTYVKVSGGDDNGRGAADYVSSALTTAAGIWSATSSGSVLGRRWHDRQRDEAIDRKLPRVLGRR